MSHIMARFSRNYSMIAIAIFGATTSIICGDALRGDDEILKTQLDFFEAKIRPVLIRECYGCHSVEAAAKGKLRGELLLDSRDAARKGGESGPAVVPGKAEESLLLSALKHEDLEMPPKGKLDAAIIADFEKWIQTGAADPRDGQPAARVAVRDVEARRDFWSFRPLAKSQPPIVADSSKWVRSDVDRYVLARLESSNLVPNPVADARVLVRRAWVDLLGLPPTPAEIREWTDRLGTGGIDSEAWAALIDHLLLSPHYGERQARHWMDVARFAESHGYEQDYDRPNAYHYRDFLIRAFNSNLPYDQFVQWQLAGDELRPEEPLAWMATGFLCGGAFPTQLTEAEFESARYDELDDMVATTGVAFLGLSVGCARCHDHKFDPIPNIDYYRMAATFTTAIRCEKKLDLEPQENSKRRDAFAAKVNALESDLQNYAHDELPKLLLAWLRSEKGRDESPGAWTPLAGKVTSSKVEALSRLREELGRNTAVNLSKSPEFANAWQTAIDWFKTQDDGYRQRVVVIDKAKKAGAGEQFVTAMVTSEGLPILSHHANDRGFPHFYPETYQLRRGDVNQKAEKVNAGFLQVFTSAGGDMQRWIKQPAAPEPRLSYRRSALARWLTDADQGAGQLAARVMVNRMWQHHFGRGLVATPNDFGSAGERPSHPELLDYLASELISGGWQLKRIHKLMMTSGVYMQSSDLALDDPRQQIDRENQLYWRRAPQRLEAEAIRDALLAASGQLDTTMYGPGSIDVAMRRRSVYFFIKRSQLIPMMMLFDWPEHLVSIGQRPLTTIAPQALMFMNNPQGREYAVALAKHVQKQSAEQAVDQAYWAALSRGPKKSELKLAVEFLQQQTELRKAAGESDAEFSALTDLCQTIMSMNEFLYVD